jgi:hypothetical protein
MKYLLMIFYQFKKVEEINLFIHIFEHNKSQIINDEIINRQLLMMR